MVGVNRASKPAVHSHPLLMAIFLVTVFVAAVGLTVVTASTGHTTAALMIGLVTAGSFSTALC